jgi:SAM-dependent methyltransferase
MSTDIVDLREFYHSPLGQAAQRILRESLGLLWPRVQGETILALGYGLPLLQPLRDKGANLAALMPAEQGVAYWPSDAPNISCFADMHQLSIANESVDRVVVMHALESTPEPQGMMTEIWRVMKGGGSLVMIVPNRRGLWAHSDKTPFGTGEPYSTGQIKRLLRDHGFVVQRDAKALFMPPSSSRMVLSLAPKFEKYLPYLTPGFGGVLLIEAGKQLYAPILTSGRRVQRRLVLPLPSLAPSSASPIPS